MAFDPNDPKDVELLESKIADAVGKLDAKNKELVAELRAAKRKGEIDPKEVERLEAELDEVRGKLTAAEKDAKTAKAAAEKAAADLASEQGHTQKLLIENGLSAALLESGVKDPTMAKAAAALLRTGHKIEIAVEGDTRIAKIGDKPLGDFVKAWAGGDEGKAFVAAPGHGGGGATGGNGKTGGQVNPFAKETYSLTAQGQLYNSNPTLAKSLAAEAGVTI